MSNKISVGILKKAIKDLDDNVMVTFVSSNLEHDVHVLGLSSYSVKTIKDTRICTGPYHKEWKDELYIEFDVIKTLKQREGSK
tara:strand:+ start:186 stop:434 length:249 start_codon:yes stop_codon:yes gene_type:complete